MKGYLPDYDLVAAKDLNDALRQLAAAAGGLRPLAGGTDLMVLLEGGHLPVGKYLSLWNLDELRGISVDQTAVTLGALTTYAQMQEHQVLCREFPNLVAAARETGGVAIQSRGTLGGNIANASPAADTPPALLAYGAELELVSAAGSRRISYEGFHQGYKKTLLTPGELIARVILPRSDKPMRHYYRKVGTRKMQAISKIVIAGAAEVSGKDLVNVRIGLGSVAPTTIRARHVENLVTGRSLDEALIAAAVREVQNDIAPIDDIRSQADFRRAVTGNLVREMLAAWVG